MYGLNATSQNLYVEALTTNVAVFGDGASKEVIKVERGYKAETLIPSGPIILSLRSLTTQKKTIRRTKKSLVYKPEKEPSQELNWPEP